MRAVLPAGSNRTRLWGLTPRERLARMAAAQHLVFASGAGGGPIVANLNYVFDPAWLRVIAEKPDHVLTAGGDPVLAHVVDLEPRLAVTYAMGHGRGDLPADIAEIRLEQAQPVGDVVLGKRMVPFVGQLTPDSAPALERASYRSVTRASGDLFGRLLLTRLAWPLTRLAAHAHVTPIRLTLLALAAAVAAAILFGASWLWSGLAAAGLFTLLRMAAGQLARCTLRQSRLGALLASGADLLLPPLWWFAWDAGIPDLDPGLRAALPPILALAGLHMVGCGLENVFLRRFGFPRSSWRHFDACFAWLGSGRNPDLAILFVSLLLARPEAGLLALGAWKLVSVTVAAVRLAQAFQLSSRGQPIASWLV